MLGSLFGENALHFRDLMLHRREPVHGRAVAGTPFNSHGAGLLEAGADRRAFSREGGPRLDAKGGGNLFQAKKPAANEGKGAGVFQPAKRKATILGAKPGNVSFLRPDVFGGVPRGGQDAAKASV